MENHVPFAQEISYPGLHVTNTSLPGLPHLNGRRSAGAMLTSSDFLLCQCQLPVGGVAEVDEFWRTPCHNWEHWLYFEASHSTAVIWALNWFFQRSLDFPMVSTFLDGEKVETLWCYLAKSRLCLSREYDRYIVRYIIWILPINTILHSGYWWFILRSLSHSDDFFPLLQKGFPNCILIVVCEVIPGYTLLLQVGFSVGFTDVTMTAPLTVQGFEHAPRLK